MSLSPDGVVVEGVHVPTPVATAEQDAAVQAFRAGSHMVLQAGAGTGKTSTLAMLGKATGRRGKYIAFNKSIAQEAARTFPANVSCKTGHSLAWSGVGHRFSARLNGARVPGWKIGRALGITAGVRIGERMVSDRALSYSTLETVKRFCQSADRSIQARHVQRLRGLEAPQLHERLIEVVLPYAERAWADLQNPDGGVVRFEHDHYLKMWALSRPRIYADFLLLDEAQDTNPVLEEVFEAQRAHAQLVMVGDSAQAIYGWRGARDVMTGFTGTHLTLSRSFRFGPALAAEANRWLSIADAAIRLEGSPAVATLVGPVPDPDVILCRSNVGAMVEVMRLLDAGRTVAFVGMGADLHALATAARELKDGRRPSHPDLMLFENWHELQDYAEYDPSGHDLLPLVDLVDDHGTDVILDAVARLSSEDAAEVSVSTAHRAKGREWSSVRIAEDFIEPLDGEEVDAAGLPLPGKLDKGEARLAYVAVTRARHRLDLGGLSWIHRHPQGNPRRAPALAPARPSRGWDDPGRSASTWPRA